MKSEDETIDTTAKNDGKMVLKHLQFDADDYEKQKETN